VWFPFANWNWIISPTAAVTVSGTNLSTEALVAEPTVTTWVLTSAADWC
jgi:hypothetical protein